MNVRLLAAAIVVFVCGAGHAARADSVDDYIKSEMAKQQIPGLSVAVIRDGKTIKLKGYGVADLEQKAPVTVQTAYDLGSLAKPFTAAAILTLVERGRIRLADPVGRFLADVPGGWRGITVWHLLTNTSGIKDYTSELPTTAALEFTPELIYHRAGATTLNFPPGTQYRYSQTNYVLLGMIIESATGRPFQDMVADRIYKPLQMTHTPNEAARRPVPNLATGYRLVNGERAPAERETHGLADSFGASTVADLALWAAALDTGAILSEPARTLMWTPAQLAPPTAARRPLPGAPPAAAPPAATTAPFGAGWFTEQLNGHRVIGHGGSVGGFSTNLTRFPDDHLTVIVLTNLRDVKVFPLVRGIASRYSAALK